MSGTYTATATGYVNFQIYNWRDEEETTNVTNYVDNVRIYPETPNFETATREITASGGGTADFTIDAGAAYANKQYIILSCFSNCHPGFVKNGTHVPINIDFWTYMAIEFSLAGYWAGFYTTLDANGQGSATFNTFGPQPAAKELVLYFSYMVMNKPTSQPIFASHPIYVYLN